MTMTLNELRFIVAVAQELNFRRAAEKTFISQPALSLAIQKLEEELGLKIFERGKSEITVTPIGSAVVEQAMRVLEEAERISLANRLDPQRRAVFAPGSYSGFEKDCPGNAAGN
jgi:LysR family hydrogen peroxide-inducible transcriptional activator